MAIVRMKHFRLLGLEQDRKKLLNSFQRLGCVQIDSQTSKLSDSEWAGLVKRPETNLNAAKDSVTLLQNALSVLEKYAKIKGGAIKRLFTSRPELSMGELQNEGFLKETFGIASEIQEKARKIADLLSEQGRLENTLSALCPWRKLDIPLDTKSKEYLTVCLGVCPAAADINDLCRLLEQEAEVCYAETLGNDNDQHYLSILYHPSVEDEVSGVLKSFGFSRMAFKDISGTAEENIVRTEARLERLETERKAVESFIAEFSSRKADLEQALDAASVVLQREEAAERLISTGKVYYMEGWVPANVVSKLEQFLSQVDCAYEVRAPEPDEEVPILLQNGKLLQPFNMVTKLYALPRYGNIDPNPLMAPFYAIFFGMMFADVAYGAILFLLGLIITRKSKPKGTMGYAFKLMQICGITTIVFGFVFGGFFSDAVTVIGKTYFNADWAFPTLWVSPTDYANNGPMTVLVFALGLGAVQIIAGMAIKGYLLIRDGQPLAAVMEILPWWLFFATIGVTALTSNFLWIVVGLGLIVLTQGYKKKSIVGKFFGGVVALYDITAYLSDILSYSRLMALGLAGGVIGSVFNTLGAMPGAIPFVGPVLFLIIFLFGHIFNMGINVIGTFVHAARLQYVEYFSKFYEEGGEPFRPLCAQTKYVDVIEPEA